MQEVSELELWPRTSEESRNILRSEIERKFGVAFTHAVTGMVVATADGELIAINDYFCSILGYTEGELRAVGALRSLIHPDDLHIVANWRQLAQEDPPDVFEAELRYQRADGQWLMFKVRTWPLHDKAGKLLYFFTQVFDITEATQAEQDLKAANEFKSNFLATTTHDLRSPLTTILGFAQVLRNRDFPEEDRNRYLDMIISQAERIDRMTEDLAIVSQLQTGKLSSRPEVVNINQFIMDLYPESKTPQGQEIVLDLHGDFMVEIDPHHLERILENYVGNAHKYGKGPYTISTSGSRSRVYIDVADHGSGVMAHSVDELFLPFRQAGEHRHLGTGLGLAIVKGFAQEAGGDAYYKRIGEESVFGIYLPVYRA